MTFLNPKPEISNLKSFLFKNTTINYADFGQGKVIVLLHGFLENISMWHFCMTEFSQNNRVIAIDLLGHGKSDCLGYVHTMEDQADMVFAVLQELKINKVTIIGHSMGGYIALAFAELYPKLITGLVMMNSTSYEDNLEKKANRNRAIKMVKKDYTSFVRLSIANLFAEKNRDILVQEIESVKTEALKTPLQGIIAAQEGMKIRKDRELILHLAKFPILFILSKKDPVLNYEESIKQLENTNAQLVTFDDGHMSHIENQKQLLNVLKSFIIKI